MTAILQLEHIYNGLLEKELSQDFIAKILDEHRFDTMHFYSSKLECTVIGYMQFTTDFYATD